MNFLVQNGGRNHNQSVKAERKYASTMRIDLLLESRDRAERAAQPMPDSSRMEVFSQDAPSTDFEILLQSVYDAAILTDFDGHITNANERALRFFDYDRTAITGRDVGELIAGADEGILATVIENVQSERFTLLQAHCIRRDESLFPAEISATCLKLTGETSLCFFIRDISLRRAVEDQLRIEQTAVQNAGSGIAITSPAGEIDYVNPAVCTLWQCPDHGSMPCRNISDLFCEPAVIAEVIRNAAAAHAWQGELKARRRDGGAFYVHTSVSSCVDEDDTITHLVFSFADTTKRRLDEESLRRYQDHLEELIKDRTAELETINNDLKKEITERLRVEAELRDAILKLREHDAAKSLFVSNVSHELRTPLTALIHAVESLMHGVGGQVSEPVFSYLTMMLEDCWRLDRTVCDILDLSQMEAGRLELHIDNIPFRRMVARTVESLRMEAESVPLALSLAPDGDHGFVGCDAAKMERVLMNVINNAIKFTPAGGTIEVCVETQDRDGTAGICCRVTDSGIGIPEQYLSRVTERFFRVGEQVGGTGLGLAIAKEIIDLHQGRLEIASPPPGAANGTQVTLWLPLAPPQQVMIVAHDRCACSVLVPALEQRGYRLCSYNNGQHALQVLHDGRQHIVIVDSMIPDMDGSEIVMHMKADPLLRKLPVFFLSEEHPATAKSRILDSFGIPVFLKVDGMTDLIAAVEDAFLPPYSTKTIKREQQRRG